MVEYNKCTHRDECIHHNLTSMKTSRRYTVTVTNGQLADVAKLDNADRYINVNINGTNDAVKSRIASLHNIHAHNYANLPDNDPHLHKIICPTVGTRTATRNRFHVIKQKYICPITLR